MTDITRMNAGINTTYGTDSVTFDPRKQIQQPNPQFLFVSNEIFRIWDMLK